MAEAFLTGPTHINLSLEGDGLFGVQSRFVVYNLYALMYNLLFQTEFTLVLQMFSLHIFFNGFFIFC